jgi:hypothetical protein
MSDTYSEDFTDSEDDLHVSAKPSTQPNTKAAYQPAAAAASPVVRAKPTAQQAKKTPGLHGESHVSHLLFIIIFMSLFHCNTAKRPPKPASSPDPHRGSQLSCPHALRRTRVLAELESKLAERDKELQDALIELKTLQKIQRRQDKVLVVRARVGPP